jgi:hypothetical protein
MEPMMLLNSKAVEISTVRRAFDRGIKFLEVAQLPNGEIPIQTAPNRDMTGAGEREPVVFCAALAARALARVPAARDVRTRALRFLMSEMEPGGLWRHPARESLGHSYTPLDVDDTALASAALEAEGWPLPNNRNFLARQRLRGGLFRTWIVRWWPHPMKIIQFFRHYAKPRDLDSVVNANAVFYLGDRRETRPAIRHMEAILRTDREMESTLWYGSRFTVWYFFSHALLKVAPEGGTEIVRKVEAAVPSDALERAEAASILLLWGRVPDIGAVLDDQLPNGGWPSAGFYHMGQRRRDAPPQPPWWGSEALTTVFALEALSGYLHRCEEARPPDTE